MLKHLKDEACRLRSIEKLSYDKIAEILKIGHTTVRRYCKDLQPFDLSEKYTEAQKNEACRLRTEGKSKKEIAKITGIKEESQVSIFCQRGILLNKEHKHQNRLAYGEEYKKRAYELRDDFYGLCQIAEILECSLSTVKYLLKDYSIDPERRKYYFSEYTPDQEFEVLELRKQGLKAEEIASLVGIKDAETVRRISSSNGVLLSEVQKASILLGSAKYSWEDVDIACQGKMLEPHIKNGPIMGRVSNEDRTLPFRCLACKKEAFYPRIHDVLYGKVGSCGCLASGPEEEVRKYISEWLGYNPSRNRSVLEGLEIDIYIEEKKVGIEFCGLYWHSDARAGTEEERREVSKRHELKYNLCKEKGVRLVTIFEDEWALRPKAVLNYLKAILGIKTVSLGARKTEIVKNPANYREFLDINHIQGSGGYGMVYGLKFEDQLLAVMVFRKTQDGKLGHYELTRYCLGDVGVVGGFQKLLKAFIKDHDPVQICSFSDNRWSEGDIYKNSGFVLDSLVKRDYYYVRGQREVREGKEGYRKSKLKGLYPELFDESKTEEEVMREAGWSRIWDCGKKKWVLKL